MKLKKTAESRQPGYPDRDTAPADGSRRRFLRQIGVGAGAATVLTSLGLPQLAHGQSREVDFSLLDAHRNRDALAPAAAEMAAGDALADAAAEQSRPEAEPAPEPEPEPLAEPAEPVAAAPVAAAPAAAEPPPEQATVVENRALWIEPGYLILLRWNRPASNDDVVARLEGATEHVRSYLTVAVESVDTLHNFDQLHDLEHGVASLLEPLIAPATIDTIHLDHDCSRVCSGLSPGVGPVEPIPLGGEPVPIGWE